MAKLKGHSSTDMTFLQMAENKNYKNRQKMDKLQIERPSTTVNGDTRLMKDKIMLPSKVYAKRKENGETFTIVGTSVVDKKHSVMQLSRPEG
jgi:hypothetical protein